MFDINQMKENVGNWGKGDTQAKNETPAAGTIRTKRKSADSGSAALIGPSIRINGDLVGEEDLIIQGTVEGTINLHNNVLTIGKNGRIRANLHATTINVEGELRGDLFGSEKVVIKKTGNVKGNIIATRVTLEDGAIFKGSIEMDPKSISSIEKNSTARPEQNTGNIRENKEANLDIGKTIPERKNA